MNRHDQELLDKQLRNVQVAAQNDGVLMLAMLAVFCIGIAVGGFIYAYANMSAQTAAQVASTRVAANEAAKNASSWRQ